MHLLILHLLIEDRTVGELLASGNMALRTFLLACCSVLSFACFGLPLYVIRPFRHQGARELAVALFVKQIGPVASVVFAVLALAIVLVSWGTWRRWIGKTAAVALLFFALAGAYLARVNVYELMFHHLGNPQFEAAKDAAIDKDDMVIAVRLNGEARAYPVREMAYHHVVNDKLGGEPIASTY